MFSMFLLLIVFSFLSWLQYDPQHSFYQQQSDENAVIMSKINTGIKPILEPHKKAETGTLAKLTVPPVAAGYLPILRSVPPSSVLVSACETSLEPELRELVIGVNIDNLQLRPAREIAKAFNIAQRINGRDKTLGFLRSQIKVKFQQSQELARETAEIVRELLVSYPNPHRGIF